MAIRRLLAALACLIGGSAQAAFITVDEAGMDAVFGQASFGAQTVDIRVGPSSQLLAPTLLHIDANIEISQLFSQHVGPANVVNFYYVDTIDYCGGFNVNYIGCGEIGGPNFVVESSFAAQSFGALLLSHELGHNLGLGHWQDVNNLMYPSLAGGSLLNASQVSSILASPLVQMDGSGQRFIQINPVLVVASVVPEPASWLMLLGGLAAVAGWARRRAASA